MSTYTKPVVEVIGSLHELTLAPVGPGKPKVVGNDLDGIKLKPGNSNFPLGLS